MANEITLKEFVNTVMASKGINATELARLKGVKPSTITLALQKPSMSLSNLDSMLKAMDESVTLVLENGNRYTLKF